MLAGGAAIRSFGPERGREALPHPAPALAPSRSSSGTEAYARECGWRVPELLTRALRVDDLYFDAVSTVALPTWSTGRVVLVGDAAASVSLFGDGSSLAIAGARTLATALAEGDHVTAFRRYESEHRRRTDAPGRGAGLVAAMLIPKSRAGILVRNAAARLLPTGPAEPH